MTIIELKKAIENDKIEYGVKQALRNNHNKVFLSNDARTETEALLKEKGIEIIRLNEDKERIAKDLKLGFMSEVFSLTGEKKEKAKEKTEEKKEKKPAVKKVKKAKAEKKEDAA